MVTRADPAHSGMGKVELYDKNPIKGLYSNYPKSVLTLALLASHTIPRILDPEGEKNTRPPLSRFLTITLPDNAVLAALIMANSIPDLAALQDPSTLLASIFFTGGICKILEFARTAAAWGTDKISDNQSLVNPNRIREIASIIGPRDFYAREVNN